MEKKKSVSKPVKEENWDGVFKALEKCFEIRRPSEISADYCCSCCGGEFLPNFNTSCDYSCGS